MTVKPITVVGDVVLDSDVVGRTERLSPDAPVPVVDVEGTQERPGGAGLAARLCAVGDVDVTLVAPLAADEPGRRLTAMLDRELTVVPLGHAGRTRRKTRVLSHGQVVVRLDDGGPGTPVDVLDAPEARRAVYGAGVVLVSDYGAGTTRDGVIRRLLAEVARRVPLVWDPHPRGGPPVSGAIVTPNLAEAREACRRAGIHADEPVDRLVVALREHWRARAVCVTAGGAGAYLAVPGCEPMYLPAPAMVTGNTCGAGDKFVATVTNRLAHGDVLSQAVTAGVSEATAWVAAGGVNLVTGPSNGSASHPFTLVSRDLELLVPVGPPGSAQDRNGGGDRIGQVRSRGGTVVATGGCFDILHAGHVACLQAARRLGDALVVLINSDTSARRLKGPGRPVVTAEDRARVLLALGCVDAVEVFDGDDPRAALERIRPDVWAKGADYTGVPLPEAELVRSWGGRVVLVPYVDGHSTTSILRRSVSNGRTPDYEEAS